jgi:hypothetical protein
VHSINHRIGYLVSSILNSRSSILIDTRRKKRVFFLHWFIWRIGQLNNCYVIKKEKQIYLRRKHMDSTCSYYINMCYSKLMTTGMLHHHSYLITFLVFFLFHLTRLEIQITSTISYRSRSRRSNWSICRRNSVIDSWRPGNGRSVSRWIFRSKVLKDSKFASSFLISFLVV